VALIGATFGAQYLYGFFWAFYSLFGLSLIALRPVTIGELFFSLIMGIIGLCLIVALIAGKNLISFSLFFS
jgi:hypothetical protein